MGVIMSLHKEKIAPIDAIIFLSPLLLIFAGIDVLPSCCHPRNPIKIRRANSPYLYLRKSNTNWVIRAFNNKCEYITRLFSSF